jgi:transposase-like protein
MNRIKRVHSPAFKAQVALDLIRGIVTMSQICSRHRIHPTQAGKWKAEATAGLSSVFENKPNTQLKEKDEFIDTLYKQIGKLKIEMDWLKKKMDTS